MAKRKKKRRRSNRFSLPSASTLAIAGVSGLWLAGRQNSHGIPYKELQKGNFGNAGMSLLKNAAAMITTGEGIAKVILPIVGISLARKFLPRVQVNLFGMNWRIL